MRWKADALHKNSRHLFLLAAFSLDKDGSLFVNHLYCWVSCLREFGRSLLQKYWRYKDRS